MTGSSYNASVSAAMDCVSTDISNERSSDNVSLAYGFSGNVFFAHGSSGNRSLEYGSSGNISLS